MIDDTVALMMVKIIVVLVVKIKNGDDYHNDKNRI